MWMACSSNRGPIIVTSLQIWGWSDFRNQSSRNELGMSALISLDRLFHSWIWSEMWVASPCWKEVNNSVLESYQIGSWKWCKNALAKLSKSANPADGNSIYHLVYAPIKVLWKILNWTLSSIKEFKEHHRWKVMAWVLGSSFAFPSNLGMSEGNLVGIGGQMGECLIGSLNNLDKSGKFRVARNGIFGGGIVFQFC